MPIYEYECSSCGKHFEHMQRITEEPLSVCPFCTGTVKKLVSNCYFQLKGSGWYVTDYAKKSSDSGKKEGHKKQEATKEGTATDASTDSSKDKSPAKEAVSEKAVNQ